MHRALRQIFQIYLAAIFLSGISVVRGETGKAVLVLVGDSTVAEWAEANPARGWGQALPGFLTENIEVVNLAVCGASTKTFPETGNWARALEVKPHFLFIQFGHNDSHALDKPESTRADGDFQDNLRRYIREAREIGACPVLITPMHRRMFDAKGNPTQELAPYARAASAVAASEKIPLVDLYESSGKLLTDLGEAGSCGLTVSEQDRTHFTPEGAKVMAGLVVEGLRGAVPDFQKYIRPASSTP